MSASSESVTVPPNREFTAVWVAYALFGAAVFFWWPALLALIVCYSKRGAADGGFLTSHHRWLIRTFWWSLLGYIVGALVVVGAAWPFVRDAMRTASRRGGQIEQSFNIDWSSIFTTAGGALLGALLLFAAWVWFVYRVVRGLMRLSDARSAP